MHKGKTPCDQTAAGSCDKPVEHLISDRIAEFSEQYDSLYDRAMEFVRKYAVCNIHEENGHITCNGENCELKLWRFDTLCCNRCPTHYYKDGACSVKALGCKLFICQKALDRLSREGRREYRQLRKEMTDLLQPFGIRKYVYLSKEDFTARLKSGTSLKKKQ